MSNGTFVGLTAAISNFIVGGEAVPDASSTPTLDECYRNCSPNWSSTEEDLLSECQTKYEHKCERLEEKFKIYSKCFENCLLTGVRWQQREQDQSTQPTLSPTQLGGMVTY